MNKKHILLTSILLSAALNSGCSSTSGKLAETTVPADTDTIVMNNYPTRDRVEYVFNCIAKHGGKLSYIVQYACGCKIDKIAERLTFKEYEAASTFTTLRSSPGEKGAVFRDPKQAKDLPKLLKEAELYAEGQCFVK